MINQLFLPTLSDIVAQDEVNLSSNLLPLSSSHQIPNRRCSSPDLKQELKAEREWYSGIQALNQLLEQVCQENPALQQTDCPSIRHQKTNQDLSLPVHNNGQTNPSFSRLGLILSGPVPVLIHPSLAIHFTTQIFTHDLSKVADGLTHRLRKPLALLPSTDGVSASSIPETLACPLHSQDPLVKEQFCLVLTAGFSLVMVLGNNAEGEPAFLFSFDPDIVKACLDVLCDRMALITVSSHRELANQVTKQIAELNELITEFVPISPHYKTVTKFSRLLLNSLCLEEEKKADFSAFQSKLKTVSFAVEKVTELTGKNSSEKRQFIAKKSSIDSSIQSAEVELLQAIAHEVRTPLATIRTLTRLLLKRPDLPVEVVRKRLEMIDQECTTQIDRFNLIFKAVELEMQQTQAMSRNSAEEKPLNLTAMSLGDVFKSSLPRWQKQASQRNHTLEVILPQKLPTVVSDPTMLDQVLSGVIENFTRSLPDGSHIQVGVRLAGHQLKLQLESQPQPGSDRKSSCVASPKSPLKSLGPLLMFQPETGSLSLNMTVTKNLFQALGGKLVVKERPQQGNVMTIYLPLELN